MRDRDLVENVFCIHRIIDLILAVFEIFFLPINIYPDLSVLIFFDRLL